MQQISLIGGFVLSVDGATIADTMVSMSGAGALAADTLTGSSAAVTGGGADTVDVIGGLLGSTFSGQWLSR